MSTSSQATADDYPNSENGQGLNHQANRRVREWINRQDMDDREESPTPRSATTLSSHPSTAYEVQSTISSLARQVSATTLDDSKSDLLLPLIQHWRKTGINAFQNKQYSEAEANLSQFLSRATARYGQQFDGRDEAMNILCQIYIEHGKYEKAEDTLRTHFDGREKLVDVLLMTYCTLNCWDGAERLAQSDLRRRDTRMKTLVTAYLQNKEWDLVEEVLVEILEDQRKRGRSHEQIFETQHLLAEVCLAKGELELGVEFCLEAASGRLSALGSEHLLYYQSIALLVEIHRAKGANLDADAFNAQLPGNYRGIFQYD